MSDESTVVACCHHPDQAATHNCLGCGNPLCMECVKASGYYCSVACKEAVRASEPDAVAADDQQYAAVERNIDATLATTKRFLATLKLPVVIAVLAVGGWYTYAWLFAKQGQVVASTDVTSTLATFHAELVGPGQFLVQRGDEVFIWKLPDNKAVWSANMARYAAPAAADPEEGDSPLRCLGRAGDLVVVAATTRLVAIDAASGQVRWQQQTSPSNRWTEVLAQPAGVVCYGVGTVQVLAPATGQPLWQQPLTTTPLVAGDRLVLLERPAPRARTSKLDDEEEIPTAGGGQFNAKNLLGLAKGETPPAPTVAYRLRTVALADGTISPELTISLAGSPAVHLSGANLLVTGGDQLALVDGQAKRLWQARASGTIEQVALTDKLVVVATENRLTAFDAATGELKWTRDDLVAEAVTAGPGGNLYASVAVTNTAAETYPSARVATRGFAMPAERVPVLMRLDAANGKTLWGIRNIGQHVVCEQEAVYVFDSNDRADLLSDSGMTTSEYAVRQINPRTGKDLWLCIRKGQLVNQWVRDGKAYVVVSTMAPGGSRDNPTGFYALQLIAAK